MTGPMKSRPGIRCVLALLLALSATLPAAPGRAAETGTLAGVLLDAGRPVAAAGVLLQTGRDPVQLATTGADGTFRADGLNPGSFYLIFALPDGGVRQWYPGAGEISTAEPVTISAGEVSMITNTLAPYGSIAGRVTYDDGSPAPAAKLSVGPNPRVPVAVTTGPDGGYRLNYLQPGTHRLQVQAAATGAPAQYVHRVLDAGAATAVAVTAGARVAVDERLLPLGTVTGRLSGDPAAIAGVTVSAEPVGEGTGVEATTAADGSFRLFVFPGRYHLHFTPRDGIEQWAHGSPTAQGAAVLTVAAGQDLRVEETILATGTLGGRLLDADGLPLTGTVVDALDEASGQQRRTYTDGDGTWSVRALPGRYLVRFGPTRSGNRAQWVRGAASPDDATPFVVRAGATTTADDRLLPAGTLAVTATDARTGRPVTGFCATASSGYESHQACTETTRLVLDGLSPYPFRLEVTADGRQASTTTVRVRSGRTTEARPTLTPDATVTVTLRDAKTGAPVAGCVTVFAVPAEPAVLSRSTCADGTAPVTVGRLAAGPSVVFVQPTDDVHGAQWVGRDGGTGLRSQARVLNLAAGGSATLNARIDRAGSISGTVTAAATGERLESVLVEIGAEHALVAFTADGAYRIDGLGPYRWPLQFRSDALGTQWSGGSPTPADAVPVQVRTGGTATADAALKPATTVTGTVIGAGGHVPDWGRITAWDAQSLLYLSSGSVWQGRYTMPVLGPNRVRLTYAAGFRGSLLTAEGPVDGTLAVPTSGQVTKNLELPEQTVPAS